MSTTTGVWLIGARGGIATCVTVGLAAIRKTRRERRNKTIGFRISLEKSLLQEKHALLKKLRQI
jgi:hypothetical protein